jgi:glycosyltransferase involved in cell wall biosynthesis
VLDRFVFRRASVVVVSTGAAGRGLIERYRVSPWRVKIQPLTEPPGRPSSDERVAARERWSLSPGTFAVCYVNAPVSPAEAQMLLEAWGGLIANRAAAHEERPVRLLLASAGDSRGALGASTVTSDFTETVTVVGRLDGDDLDDLFRAADVNIVTSDSTGTGATAIAAATRGTPSIAAGPDVVAELAALDPTLIVAPRDSDTLTRRLESAALGVLPDREGTRTWAARQQWDRLIALHSQLYDDFGSKPAARERKTKVVYVGHVARLSGGEIALARLIAALDDVSAHVILAEDGPLVERLQRSGISVEVLPLPERTRDLRKDRVRPSGLPIVALIDTAVYVVRLARRLRAIRPDLVHTNTLKAGVYGSLAARLAGIPVVWHVRDRISSDYLKRPAVLLLRALIALLPDGVIVNSVATGQTLWRTRGAQAAIHSPIPDPISWRPIERQSGGERFVVGMIGRITPWKGQHVLIEAFAKAFAGGTETAVIVGAAMFGEEEVAYEAGLHDLAQSLGVADRVIFRGFREDTWRELVDMDVFVHASTTPEPFGQVIVEAMLAGTPVIAVGAGGPTEIVTDGVTGVLYPPADVDALAEALVRLRNDGVLRDRLAKNALVRAAEFSPENVATAVSVLYRRTLRRPQEVL